MNVTMKCHTNPNKPGIVYATVNAGGVEISATLDYCLSVCRERGYVIENANDVLYWLHMNAEFVA